jgi:hypothetical protein
MSRSWLMLTTPAARLRRWSNGRFDGHAPAPSEMGPADAIVRLFRGEDVLSVVGLPASPEATEDREPSYSLPRRHRRAPSV